MRKLIVIPGFVLLSIGSIFLYFGLRAYLYPQGLGSIQGGLGVAVLGLFMAIMGILLVMSGVFLKGDGGKPQRSNEKASEIGMISLIREKKQAVIYALLALLLMSTLATRTVKADPSIPKKTPSGDNPVNVVWRGNGYATLVTAQMIDFGWEMGDTLSQNDAFAMLMWKDGLLARWYMWIYEGGFFEDPYWRYWSYASVARYSFDPNPFHWGWYVDNWEGAQDKVHLQWRDESTPWENVDVNYYYLGNEGQYHGVWSGDYASIIDISDYASREETWQWTTNSRFLLNGQSNYWDTVTYCWDWNPFDGKYQGNTWEVSPSETHYAEWNQDGLVELSAEDTGQPDTKGAAARVTYGPFKAVDYPFYPPPELQMHLTSNVCLLGAVSNYGTEASGGNSWTGMKFDAWFEDPGNNDRPLVIEMYFAGTGVQILWGNEYPRTLANNTVDDYMIKLQAFPEYAQIIGPRPYSLGTDGEWKSTLFLIDLKSIYNRAKGNFQRSNSDLLYAVALDLESGIGLVGHAGRVWADVNQIRVTYSLPPPWPGGGGCPWVSAWNGTQYAFDNNLIPAAEHSNGTDIVDYYRLQQPVARDEGKYSLLISDTDKHSFLDQAQLLAIDHKADVNVAVSPYGEILTYRSPASPVTAISQDGENLTSILGSFDGQYYEGYKDDYVTLDFGNLDTSNGAKLVLRTDPSGCGEPFPCKESIHVQISNSTGSWSDVASFIPRLYWATDIIDLSSYLPDANGNLKVRLHFTANHRIDYVGLDTTAQAKTEQQCANLATANHSRLGDVKDLFKYSDNLRVELLPGDYVTLQFTAPQLQEEKRDFIIILEGHYFKIN